MVDTWGSTAAERIDAYPCDEVLPDPDLTVFRAIDIDADTATVFRWLAQLRVAPYSYDWIDNFGRRSPRQLTPGLDQLAVGQRFMTIFRLAHFEPGRSITVTSTTAMFGHVVGTYRVTPSPGGTSRLVVKLLSAAAGRPVARLLMPLLPAGDLVMMRRQLRTLKQLAERAR